MVFRRKAIAVLLAGVLTLQLAAYHTGEVISLRQELSKIEAMLGSNIEEHGIEFILETLAKEKVPATLVIDAPVVLQRDVSVAENVVLEFKRGNVIRLNNRKLSIDGPIKAGMWQIFDIGEVPFDDLARGRETGKVIGNSIMENIYPQWWGANDRLGGDASRGFQAAINFAKQSNSSSQIRINGQFLIRQVLNVTGGIGIQFVGAETKNQRHMVVAHTGGVLFDCSGSRQTGFKGFYIRYLKGLPGYDTPSNCAILFAGAEIPGHKDVLPECLYQEIACMYIELYHPKFRGGFGNVGICAYGMEESTIHSNQFYCDTPVIITSTSSQIAGEIKSPYVAFTEAHSVGVNTFSGENMLVRWNHRSYNMVLRGVNTLNLGNIYFGNMIWKGENGPKELPAIHVSHNLDVITGNVKMEQIPGVFELVPGARVSCVDIRTELGHPGNRHQPEHPVVTMAGNVHLQDWELRISYPIYCAGSPWQPPKKSVFGFRTDPGSLNNVEMNHVRVYSNQTAALLPQVLPPALQKKARNVELHFRDGSYRFDRK